MIELIQELISFIVHIDVHLEEIIRDFGNWSFLILFAIVFVETGVVIFPFLPGDSLLFASGTLAAAMGAFDMWILIPVFLAAAILGDTMNYNILGAILWVFSCTLLGYFFGNIPIIKDNFSVVLILIIFISVVPAVIGAIKAKVSK